VSRKNDDFFVAKREWSKVKDDLLGCYLKPYTSKILFTNKPLMYVDCFAGKGKFDDGTNGSPMIALGIFEECLRISNARTPSISSCFIDSKYAEELHVNLSQFSNITIIDGRYEEVIRQILENKVNYNIFLYIDPFGIKSLDFNLFKYFGDIRCNSIELLINFNSFGFLREACRALPVDDVVRNAYEDDAFEDEVDNDEEMFEGTTKSINELSEIAGGDYWKDIATRLKKKLISSYAAEKEFSSVYCKQLQKKFKYVLSMPIRLKQGQQPKYRMIHASNHVEGCILMFDNITKRKQYLGDIQTQGSITLFEMNVENEVVDTPSIRLNFIKHMRQYSEFTNILKVTADFIMDYGVVCDPKDIRVIIANLERENAILVRRTPCINNNGTPYKSLIPTRGHIIELRNR